MALFCSPCCPCCGRTGLQVVHHALQFRQHLLGLIARAGARQIFDLVHHALQILLAQHVVHLRIVHGALRVLHRLLGQRLHELLHGLAQFLHQARDLLVGRIVLQRILQRLLGVAQAALGQRQIAVLDAERDLPEIIGGAAQHVVIIGEGQTGAGRPHGEEMRDIGDRLVGAGGERVVQLQRAGHAVGVEGEDLALFGDGAGQRLIEALGRQDHLLRLAAAFLSGGVPGDQRDAHGLAGERMFAEVAAGQPLDVLGVAARQIQPVFRRGIERARILGGRFDGDDLGPGFGDAVIVLAAEADFQRGGDRRLRLAVKGDLGRGIRGDGKGPALAADHQRAGLIDLEKMRGGAGRRRGGGLLDGLGCRRFGRCRACRRFARWLSGPLASAGLGLRLQLLCGDGNGRAAGFGFEADGCIAAARKAHGGFGELRHGEHRLSARRLVRRGGGGAGLFAGQEHRRLAGIGGRGHPGVDAQVRLDDGRFGQVEGIGNEAGPVGIGIGKGECGDQHGCGAQRERVVAGQVRLRGAGRQRADGAGHAGLMLAPERVGGRAAGGDGFVLNADRLVAQAVAGLQHAVGRLRWRQTQTQQRQEGRQKAEAEEGERAEMGPERHEAEKAEPGGGDEEKQDGDRQQKLRRHGFGQQHGAGGEPLAGQQARQRPGAIRSSRRCRGHPSFSSSVGVFAASLRPWRARSVRRG